MAVSTNEMKGNENDVGLFIKTKGVLINVMRMEGPKSGCCDLDISQMN